VLDEMTGLYLFFLAVGAPLLLWMVFAGDADGEGVGYDFDGDGELTAIPLSAIAGFMATFGGIGLIGDLTGAGFLLTLLFSIAAAMAMAVATQKLFSLAGDTEMSSEVTSAELEGSIAQVALPVSDEHRGKIIVDIAGAREQMTASPADGSSIDAGEKVVIVRVDRGVALVAPLGRDLELEK
jgi:membrane protein implicated in regulation of membrane protease activity